MHTHTHINKARPTSLYKPNHSLSPTNQTNQFRKRAIVALPALRYLDRPVFEQERLAAEAWATVSGLFVVFRACVGG